MLHQRRLDARVFRRLREGGHQAGASLGTRGMLLGHYDEGISFTGPQSFRWLHRLNAATSLSHYFDTQDWPYLWNVGARVRWDVLRWHFLIPYLEGGLEWRSAHRRYHDTFEYYMEPGVRFKGVLDLALFYRFQHQEAIWSAKGPWENQSLIGIRTLF